MPEHNASCYPVDKIKLRETWRELFLTLVKYTVLVQKKEKREKKKKDIAKTLQCWQKASKLMPEALKIILKNS